jgi:hypothetical protein
MVLTVYMLSIAVGGRLLGVLQEILGVRFMHSALFLTTTFIREMYVHSFSIQNMVRVYDFKNACSPIDERCPLLSGVSCL